MDKTLNRKIGYVPGLKVSDSSKKSVIVDNITVSDKRSGAPESVKKGLSLKVLKYLRENGPKQKPTSESIVKWINDHPFFKWSGMCVTLGIDKGNFGKILKDNPKGIKPEQLESIVSIIEEYGYRF